jgi:hypothetical protein
VSRQDFVFDSAFEIGGYFGTALGAPRLNSSMPDARKTVGTGVSAIGVDAVDMGKTLSPQPGGRSIC